MEAAIRGKHYTSRPKHRLFDQRTGGWYLIDFARGRPGNPARIPVSFGPPAYHLNGLVNEHLGKNRNQKREDEPHHPLHHVHAGFER
jgi:hypothetical protein